MPASPARSPSTAPWQPSLFAGDEPSLDRSFATLVRTWLDDESWVDHAPGWLAGADAVLLALTDELPWRQREVTMYHRRLPEPRLTSWWSSAASPAEPLPVLGAARQLLSERYAKPFDSIGFNLYRDGRDSVAWHSDRERFDHEDPVVVILSTGSPRPFRVRPTGGGPSRGWSLGDGDLLVMGGACQHDWQHSVPKLAKVDGPRLSIMFRHHLADVAPDGDEQPSWES
jgi:alkylated DNA repair dioxygenase AlkB